jgi:hypothetical protein
MARIFLDHVVRDEKDLLSHYEYIRMNVERWQKDKYFIKDNNSCSEKACLFLNEFLAILFWLSRPQPYEVIARLHTVTPVEAHHRPTRFPTKLLTLPP